MRVFTKLGLLFRARQQYLPSLGADPLLGIDIGSQTVKLIQLTNKNGRCRLKYAGVRSLPLGSGESGGTNVERGLEEAIRELVEECHIQQTKVACSLNGPAVIVKSIQVPRMTDEELDEHLHWEMDHYISSDVSEVNWDYHSLDLGHQTPSGMRMSVLLVAARKEAVKRRTDILHRVGLNPIVMSVDNLALGNMYAFNYHRSNPPSAMLVNVSPSGLGMIVVSKGYPIYMREVECVSDEYRVLVERASNVPLNKWPSVDKSAVFGTLGCPLPEVNQEVLQEVKKTFEFCGDLDPQCQVEKLFLCGGYAGLPGLSKAMETELMRPLEHIDPFKNIEIPSEWESQNFFEGFKSLAGVAIGLGLYGIDDG